MDFFFLLYQFHQIFFFLKLMVNPGVYSDSFCVTRLQNEIDILWIFPWNSYQLWFGMVSHNLARFFFWLMFIHFFSSLLSLISASSPSLSQDGCPARSRRCVVFSKTRLCSFNKIHHNRLFAFFFFWQKLKTKRTKE